jgi:enterochelin esterase-like enzyme
VYLPAGYDANPERRYPVLYVMYGDEMLQDGHLDAVLDREIGSTMGPVIGVFVQSTSGYEYARTFRDAHRRMLAEELVPWIDARYRTVPDPARRALLGADEGAFGALDAGLGYPGIFGHVAAQSVFALSKGEDELLAVIDKAPRTSQRFYVDWGRYDPRRRSDELDVPGVSRKLRDRLAARGFAVDGREWNDGSATVFWTTRVVPALRAMFPR